MCDAINRAGTARREITAVPGFRLRKHIGKKFKDYHRGVLGTSSARHIRQCNTPSIERQYEAAYLSLFLLLSRAHFYERIHQPDYRWSLNSAYGFFPPAPPYLPTTPPPPPSLLFPSSLSFSLCSTYLYGLFSHILFIPPTSFLLRGMGKVFLDAESQERAGRRSIQVKVKESSTVPNIFTLDVIPAIPDRRLRRLRLLLNDVKSFLSIVAVIRQDALVRRFSRCHTKRQTYAEIGKNFKVTSKEKMENFSYKL